MKSRGVQAALHSPALRHLGIYHRSFIESLAMKPKERASWLVVGAVIDTILRFKGTIIPYTPIAYDNMKVELKSHMEKYLR